MNTLRYLLALIVVLTYPFAVGSWLLTHPFVGFWRRAGQLAFYSTMIALSAASIGALYALRDRLLAVDFGAREILWPFALFFYGLSVYLELHSRKHLKLKIRLGVPELAQDGRGGHLITEGIYSRIRHPRYVAVWLGTVAVALFTNYLAVYVVAVALPPVLYLVVVFEERELLARFGTDYGLYTEKVPRFFPRARR